MSFLYHHLACLHMTLLRSPAVRLAIDRDSALLPLILPRTASINAGRNHTHTVTQRQKMSSSHSTNGHTNRLANAKSPDLLQHAKHPVSTYSPATTTKLTRVSLSIQVDDIPHPHANMAHLATPDFLASIRALYPSTSSCDPNLWAVVAAVSFGASNVAEAVPLVFTWALDELIQAQHRANTPTDAANAEQLALARKIREALLQSGLLSGMPRVSRRHLS